jgi:hypothetical protein
MPPAFPFQFAALIFDGLGGVIPLLFIITNYVLNLDFDYFLGSAFRAALMHQAYNPPDIDNIFFVQDACPDLSEIFEQKKRRFFKRTSSAVWGKAPVTHKFN